MNDDPEPEDSVTHDLASNKLCLQCVAIRVSYLTSTILQTSLILSSVHSPISEAGGSISLSLSIHPLTSVVDSEKNI